MLAHLTQRSTRISQLLNYPVCTCPNLILIESVPIQIVCLPLTKHIYYILLEKPLPPVENITHSLSNH